MLYNFLLPSMIWYIFNMCDNLCPIGSLLGRKIASKKIPSENYITSPLPFKSMMFRVFPFGGICFSRSLEGSRYLGTLRTSADGGCPEGRITTSFDRGDAVSPGAALFVCLSRWYPFEVFHWSKSQRIIVSCCACKCRWVSCCMIYCYV